VPISSDADVENVIGLFRLGYERALAKAPLTRSE
jgi:hypothetical protein